jgi:type I restriction enzyme R subunit
LNNKSLNADQIHFINTIIDYLSVNGIIENKILFDKPFTEINDEGLTGVFNLEEAGNIVKIVDRINKNAMEAV